MRCEWGPLAVDEEAQPAADLRRVLVLARAARHVAAAPQVAHMGVAVVARAQRRVERRPRGAVERRLRAAAAALGGAQSAEAQPLVPLGWAAEPLDAEPVEHVHVLAGAREHVAQQRLGANRCEERCEERCEYKYEHRCE